MPRANKPGIFRMIARIAAGYLERLHDITQLAGLEAKLAVKTLREMIILGFFLILILFSTWLSLQVLILVILISFQFSLVVSAGIVVLFNLLILLSGAIYLFIIKRNLYFPATRKHLKRLTSRGDE